MGYDQYTVLDTVAVKTSFVAFLQHAQTYAHGLLCNSFKFLWRTANSKPPTLPFGIVACTFSDNLSRNSCIPPTECGFPQFCRTNCYYSFNNQDDRSTLFLNTKYGIDLIIKRFHEEYSVIQDCSLSYNNLLLCGMVCRAIIGFQRKRSKISKITYTAIRFVLLTSAIFAVRAGDVRHFRLGPGRKPKKLSNIRLFGSNKKLKA